jgi:hypothetical protein
MCSLLTLERSNEVGLLLYAWAHETLCEQLRCCIGAWARQIVECMAEVSRQMCSSRWRPWYREFVASRAVGPCSTPEGFEVVVGVL